MGRKGGLTFIAERQLSSGGFLAYDVARPKRAFETTFIPSLMGIALQDIPGTRAIRGQIAEFLLEQKSAQWSWNYWNRHAQEAVREPYPDDLDDSFLAAAFLWNFQGELFTPAVMAQLVQLLFMTETQPGGPYRTWIAGEGSTKPWRDIDVVVNGNVAGFLALGDVSLPNLETLVEKAIEKEQLTSPYYPGLLPCAYLTARWYRGKQVPRLCEQILALRKDGIWGDSHQTALAVSALLRLGHSTEELKMAISYIRRTQKADGSWPFGAMYIGDVEYGAPELTAALCLEALSLYGCMRSKDVTAPSIQEDPAYEAAISEARATISSLSHLELKQSASMALDRIIAQDMDHQVAMLPYIMQKVIKKDVEHDILHRLAMVSIWGWMAYTVFDDFLDEEGDTRLLPGAVFAHRRMLAAVLAALPTNAAFREEVRDILNRLDGANAWEMSNCRAKFVGRRLVIDKLPDYGDLWQLADRSLGHIISAIGVLYAADYAPGSAETTAVRDFFRHYLIARQLNDDAHDWQDDLRRGHVNAVAVLVLRRWLGGAKGRTMAKGIDLKRQGDQLRLIMWEQVIAEVCETVEFHIAQAKQAVTEVSGLDPTPFLAVLYPLGQATKEALKARNDALEFIAEL